MKGTGKLIRSGGKYFQPYYLFVLLIFTLSGNPLREVFFSKELYLLGLILVLFRS